MQNRKDALVILESDLMDTGEDKTLYCYEYPKPSMTATVVIYDFFTNNILLIKRKEEPEKNKWAFPGGFLDVYKETLEDTAVREVREETGLRIKRNDLVFIDMRSNPERDPRGHIIDCGYFVELMLTENETSLVKAGDDAEEVMWVQKDDIKNYELAFDLGKLWDNVEKNIFHKLR